MTRTRGLAVRMTAAALLMSAALISVKRCGGGDGYRPTPDRWLSDVRDQRSEVRGQRVSAGPLWPYRAHGTSATPNVPCATFNI